MKNEFNYKASISFISVGGIAFFSNAPLIAWLIPLSIGVVAGLEVASSKITCKRKL